MKIFFIRHGETEHNVKQLLAGVTDSRLTNHGVLQARLLGAHLADRSLCFTHIYASDLQRAHMTGQAVADAQRKRESTPILDVVRLPCLREQDFGSNELVQWDSKRWEESLHNRRPDQVDATFVPKETVEAMKKRASTFLDNFIIPPLATDVEEQSTVAVVSHGIFLGILWRNFVERFGPGAVTLSPSAVGNNFGASFSPLEHIGTWPGGVWSNTGYLEVEIRPRSTPNGMAALLNSDELEASPSNAKSRLYALPGRSMVIQTINGQEHLKTLKKTRGGLGSLAYDPKQKDIGNFFKKPTAEHENAVETGAVLKKKALDVEIQVEAQEHLRETKSRYENAIETGKPWTRH